MKNSALALTYLRPRSLIGFISRSVTPAVTRRGTLGQIHVGGGDPCDKMCVKRVDTKKKLDSQASLPCDRTSPAPWWFANCWKGREREMLFRLMGWRKLEAAEN